MTESLAIEFGFYGTSHPYQDASWAYPDDDFTWCIGRASSLTLPVPHTTADLALELRIRPCLGPYVVRQRFGMAVNGTPIAQEILREEAVLRFTLPRALFADSPTVRLEFTHPDAMAPATAGISSDTRELGFAFYSLALQQTQTAAFAPAQRPPLAGDSRQALAQQAEILTGQGLATLAAGFENLGSNCEFGFVQRHFGAEPLGLLRFAAIAQPRLVEALRTGFAKLTAPGNLQAHILPNDPAQEWLLRDQHYGIETHTFQKQSEITAEAMLAQAQRRYTLLIRKLLEDIAEGQRIYVFQHPFIESAAPARAIAAALAPATLLWVSIDPTRPPGTVTRLEPNLLHGAIDTLAPDGFAASGNLLAWTCFLANARALQKEK
jgi:hypothetical protein